MSLTAYTERDPGESPDYDMMSEPAGKWSGEEVEVSFTGSLQRSDYGVPGSPVWTEVVDTEITELTVFGIKVNPDILPEELQARLYELSGEVETWT